MINLDMTYTFIAAEYLEMQTAHFRHKRKIRGNIEWTLAIPLPTAVTSLAVTFSCHILCYPHHDSKTLGVTQPQGLTVASNKHPASGTCSSRLSV